MPSKSIKKVFRSKVFVPSGDEKDPFSSRLYQIIKPSPSQNNIFILSFCRLRKIKKAPDNSSLGKSFSTSMLKPLKLFLMLTGYWQKKKRALEFKASICRSLILSGRFLGLPDQNSCPDKCGFLCIQ